MIYTGYFGQLDLYYRYNLTPIAICGKCPQWYNGIWWKHFAPSWDIFSKWKNGIETDDTYTERFFKEILSKLKIEDVKQDFNFIDNPILLCYEKEGFCHRHLVCDWLNYHGLNCEEFKIEN